MSEEQNKRFIKSLHEVKNMFLFLSHKGWLNDKTKLIRHHCDDNFIIHNVYDCNYDLRNHYSTCYQKQIPVRILAITEKPSKNKSFRHSVIIAYCDDDNTLYYKENVKTEEIDLSFPTIDLSKIIRSD